MALVEYSSETKPATMQPLAENQFRLLHLLPGNRNKPLRCELHPAPFDNPPPYEALSYVWGSSADGVEIEVDGQPHRITITLEAILLRLRLPWRAQTLWIDQLCIDQYNTKERTAQVQRMRDIYSNCTRCLLWMGELANGTSLHDAEAAVTIIKYIAALNRKEGISTPTAPRCMASDEAFRAAMKALCTISPGENPWWNRVWTLQESILPHNLVFVWGPVTISWASASDASDVWSLWCGNSPAPAGMEWSQIDTALRESSLGNILMLVRWMNSSGRGRDGPRPAAIKWRNRAATDPRDNVYALTGLYEASELPRSSRCDYSLGVNQVFINFTLDLIDFNGPTLKPLALDPRPTNGVLPGLPRWAMDMRSVPNGSPGVWRWFWFYDHRSRCCTANNGLPDAGPPEYADGYLQLPGVLVDTVKDVGPERSQNPRVDMISWWNLFCDDKSKHLPDSFPQITPMNCPEYEDFCRLVLGDWLANTDQIPTRQATDTDRQRVSEYVGVDTDHREVKNQVQNQLMNRRFFITQKGFIGLGHLETEPGDEVWVFNHGRVPFTVRPRGGPASPSGTEAKDCDFVGHCYVQGIMQGLGDDERVDRKQRQVRLY